MPGGMKDVTGFPRLTTELLRRGYAPDAVRKVLGENTLRVMGEAETIARRLQAEPGVRPPAF
jgi:membrane dipeptidase